MKPIMVFCTVLSAAALVIAGPILRPNAADALASSGKGLDKRGIFDEFLEDFFKTLNYPDDMVKRSTGLETMSANDKSMALEAAAVENRAAFESYIDDMDDDAVRKALSNSEIYNTIYDGPKGKLDITLDNKTDLDLFTLLPRAESNKYDSDSTDLDTDIQAGHDSGITKRDMGDWCHNKCRFKAAFHHDSIKYHCGCLNECINVDDPIPDCCKDILADSSTPVERSIDDKPNSTAEAIEAVDTDDDTNKLTDLTKRGELMCHWKCGWKSEFAKDYTKYYDACVSKCLGRPYTSPPTVPPMSTLDKRDSATNADCHLKCRFKAGWHSDFKKHYESCMSGCHGLEHFTPLEGSTTDDNSHLDSDFDDTSDLDIDLARRSDAGKPLYGSANPCNSTREVVKCRFKAIWSPFSFKKHFEKCMRKCNRKHGNGA